MKSYKLRVILIVLLMATVPATALLLAWSDLGESTLETVAGADFGLWIHSPGGGWRQVPGIMPTQIGVVGGYVYYTDKGGVWFLDLDADPGRPHIAIADDRWRSIRLVSALDDGRFLYILNHTAMLRHPDGQEHRMYGPDIVPSLPIAPVL